MGSPPPALSVSSFAGSQNFINAALIKCFCAVVCIRGFLILPQDPKRILLQCQLRRGSAAAVSSWKCAELSAGAQLGRSDLREHFYKSCSEFWEDPRSCLFACSYTLCKFFFYVYLIVVVRLCEFTQTDSSSYSVTWYISAPFALRSGVQSFL